MYAEPEPDRLQAGFACAGLELDALVLPLCCQDLWDITTCAPELLKIQLSLCQRTIDYRDR